MKFLIVFAALFAFCTAKPDFIAPIHYTTLPLINGDRFSYSTYTDGLISSTTSEVSSRPLHYIALQQPIARIENYHVPIAAPITYTAPITTITTPVVAQINEKTQYQAKNSAGEISYGHTEENQAHNAVQDALGNKRGSFSYISPDGRLLETNYEADESGYRVTSNALPVAPVHVQEAPQETPEVVAAREAHLAEHESAKSRSKRSLIAPLTYTAPLVYAKQYTAPIVYSKPLVYNTHYTAPLTYAAVPLATSSSYSRSIHQKPLLYHLFK